MAGNVWEWTDSWYDNQQKLRVMRGGSWNYDWADLRASSRNYDVPELKNDFIGFRVARDVPVA